MVKSSSTTFFPVQRDVDFIEKQIFQTCGMEITVVLGDNVFNFDQMVTIKFAAQPVPQW